MLAELVVEELRQQGGTLAVAESLTGGMVCSRIVDVPGASDVLVGGVVSYATRIKQGLLGVDRQLLAVGGPVQAKVAEQMAAGVAQLCGTDVGAATTGVAGPGDTNDGPAGLVYVAVAKVGNSGPERVEVRELHLVGDRQQVRKGATNAVLELLSAFLA